MNNQKIKRDQLQHRPVLLGEKIKPQGAGCETAQGVEGGAA
jgi:hypothetical protein